MNTDTLIRILDDYLELLQQQDADDAVITEVKQMIWSIEQDLKLQRFINNLTVSNSYFRR